MDKLIAYFVSLADAAAFYFKAVIAAFTSNRILLIISALLLLTYNKSFSLGKNIVKYNAKAAKRK